MDSFRYFPFFERRIVEENDFFGSKTEYEKLLLGSFISCCGSENSIWFGSGEGIVYEVGLKDGLLTALESWKAYDITVFDTKYVQDTLVTIGIDKEGEWKIKLYECLDGNIISSKLDRYHEVCISSKLGERSINIFEVCEHSQFLALGTVDGFGVMLLHGDFFKHNGYSTTFIELSEPCTSIKFISSKNSNEYYMMICTKTCIYSYMLTTKTTDPKLVYCDSMGGSSINCTSVLHNWDDNVSGVNDILVVFREEGLFCYHPLHGNCSALPTNSGNPIMLSTFKNYLILVSSQLYFDNKFSADNYTSVTKDENRRNVGKVEASVTNNICDVTICSYLPELRFVCYTGEYNNVTHIVKGLNMLFILCSNNANATGNYLASGKTSLVCDSAIPNTIFHLEEMNIFERIQILTDKNLYEWALILAKNENVNKTIYNQVQRLYGDWLCNIRKDYKSALNYYLKCLDNSNGGDTGHVVYNLLKASRLDELIIYLKECILLSKNRENTSCCNFGNSESKTPIEKEHVELLYRLLAQLNKYEEIYEFLEERSITQEISNYEIEIAIDVCRSYNKYEMAGSISELFQYHEKYITIQIEDKKSYSEALCYLQDVKLDETQKLSLILKYGIVLIANLQKPTTEFIKSLVLNNNMPIDVFLPIFIDQDKLLLDMTWDILSKDGHKLELKLEDIEELSVELCMNILQISLRQESPLEVWSKIMLERLIRVENSENWHSILCICIHYKYNYGIYYICQHCDLEQFALSQYLLKDDIQGLIEFCKYSGSKHPFLWQEALSFTLSKLSLCRDDSSSLVDYIKVILENINSLKLISPLTVLDLFSRYLTEKNPNFDSLNVGLIKPLLSNREVNGCTDFISESVGSGKTSVLNDNYEIKKMKREIKDLKHKPKILSSTRCSQCHLPLELPVVHFLCDHSFHRYCLPQQNKCHICFNETQNKVKLLKQREIQQSNKELFFKFIKGDLNRNSNFDHISKTISVLFK